jgi:metal-sulfur cluster biosynthetic enzyme
MIEAVLSALRSVLDPELDESLVDLKFVEDIRVTRGEVEVMLRLPTFWCAPNFAYLMAFDAKQAVLGVPGVRAVRVVLKDHMYSEAISSGKPFAEAFGDQADGENLEELRLLFARKAFGMRLEQLVRFLQNVGMPDSEIVTLRVDSRLPPGAAPLQATFLKRRARLGISHARLITDVDGVTLDAETLNDYLGAARKQRISMTFNALMCKGLLETRYELPRKEEAR